MKIYTKGGDKGKTSLLGGTRVSKAHLRIDAYGNVDELNSWIGLLRDENKNHDRHLLLVEIQDRLFTIGSHLANEKENPGFAIPEISEKDVERLEEAIDKMNENLPEMKNFVLPGGSREISHVHISRTVCRRAERGLAALAEIENVEAILIKYLNRLSDFLFVLSRMIAKETAIKEIPWIPKTT